MADDDDDRREGRFPDDSSPLGPLAMGPVSAQTPIQANGTFPRAAALRQILPFDGGREVSRKGQRAVSGGLVAVGFRICRFREQCPLLEVDWECRGWKDRAGHRQSA